MKWYAEETFRYTVIAIFVLGLVLLIGLSLVDKKFNPTGLWFWAFIVVILIPAKYFLRHNK